MLGYGLTWLDEIPYNLGFAFAVTLISLYMAVVEASRYVTHGIIQRTNQSLRDIFGMPAVVTTVGVVGVIFALKEAYNLCRRFTPEGQVMPTKAEEIKARRKEPSDWVEPVRPVVELATEQRTQTIEAMRERIANNTCFLRYVKSDGKVCTSRLLMLDTGIAVMPKHLRKEMEGEFPEIEIRRRREPRFTKRFIQATHYVSAKHDTDACFVTLSSAPSVASIVKYLSKKPVFGWGEFVRLQQDGEVFSCMINMESGNIASGNWKNVLPDRGYIYNVQGHTTDGDCCSALLNTQDGISLCGVHCAGNGTVSAGSPLTLEMYTEAFVALSATPFKGEAEYLFPILATGSEVDETPYGKRSITVSEEISSLHCVNYVDMFTCDGVVAGSDDSFRVKGYTQLRYSPFREPLEEAGIHIVYGPPRIRVDRAHSAALLARSDKMGEIDPMLLDRAIRDYVVPIKEKLSDIGIEHFIGRTLTLDETLNGIHDNKFINKINEHTSCGYGMKGKKDAIIDILYNATGHKVFRPKPILEQRFDEALYDLRHMQRRNPVVKTSVKDEPVEVDGYGMPIKESRLFFPFPAAEYMACKALFAGVVDALLCIPLISECMGGINTTRDEWGQIYAHLAEYGTDTAIEGDYSKWDIRLSGQMIRAGGCALIHVAAHLGYPPEDINAMCTTISDLANTPIMYNGTLVYFDGWMKSGSYLTLILNSVCNSLLHRCAFFAHCYEGTFGVTQADFRENVHLITMGDDSLATCKNGAFSQFVMASYCERIGVKYTTGNKSIVTTAYSDLREATFCKRKFRYEPKIGQYLAPLDLLSIDKTLYMYRQGDLNPIAYFVQAVRSALIEYSRHDESVYENRRAILLQVLESHDLTYLVPEIYRTHDDSCLELILRFYPDSISDVSSTETAESFTPEAFVQPSDAHSGKKSIPIHLVTNRQVRTSFSARLWIGLFCVLAMLTNPPPWFYKTNWISLFQYSTQSKKHWQHER
jgi:hypothetical protein